MNQVEPNELPGFVLYDDGTLIKPDGKVWSSKAKGYYEIAYNNDRFRIHCLVAKYFIQNPANLPLIDHIDRNIHNNDISNLRWADKSLNAINTNLRKTNSSGFKGVWYDKKRERFEASITIYYKKIFVGYFKTAEEANEAIINYKQNASSESSSESEPEVGSGNRSSK